MIADTHVEALEHVLRELLSEHRTLVDLAARHREALRSADGAAITQLSLERDRVNERIVALNNERLDVTSALAGSVRAPTRAVTVRTVLEMLEPARSAKLRSLADELRSAIESARREHSVLRDATAAFAGHLGGVLSRAVEMCSPARTYTAAGRVSVSATLPGALDVRH
jgi:hypothetical protein